MKNWVGRLREEENRNSFEGLFKDNNFFPWRWNCKGNCESAGKKIMTINFKICLLHFFITLFRGCCKYFASFIHRAWWWCWPISLIGDKNLEELRLIHDQQSWSRSETWDSGQWWHGLHSWDWSPLVTTGNIVTGSWSQHPLIIKIMAGIWYKSKIEIKERDHTAAVE